MLFIPKGESTDQVSKTPFSLVGPTNSMRWQQVIHASEFSDYSADGLMISGIFVATVGSYKVDFPHLQINASTTLRPPDGLSAVFAENIGGDEATVFDGRLTNRLSDSGITFSFDQPFYYDSRQGNLLLDFRNYAGTVWTQDEQIQPYPPKVEATYRNGDSVSAVRSTNVYSLEGFPWTDGFCMYLFIRSVFKPALQLERSQDWAVIRWPTNKLNFVLESSTNLCAPGAWLAVTNPPVRAGGEHWVTNRLGDAATFYRLRLEWNIK